MNDSLDDCPLNLLLVKLLSQNGKLFLHLLKFSGIYIFVHIRADLLVRHLFQFFLDSIESDGNILDGDSHDGGNLFIAHVFEPKKYDGTVEGLQTMDAVVKHLYLSGIVVLVVKEVDSHG